MNSGYLSAKAKVNGKWLNLILDTGAMNTCLDPIRTKHLGLAWRKHRNEGHRKASAKPASSDLSDTRSCASINSFELGASRLGINEVWDDDLSRFNRLLEQWGDLPIDGLIGADLLEQSQAIINYKDCDLSIRDAGPGEGHG